MVDVPDWSTLTSGYKVYYDPRDLLRRLRSGGDTNQCWDEIWTELHHQGDIGTASYVVLAELVSIYASRPRSWQLYSYATLIEECREERNNPDVPDWLEDAYDAALDHLKAYALADLSDAKGAGKLLSIFAFVAARSGSLGLAVALHNFDYNDHGLDMLEKYGDSLNDL